MKEYHKIDTLFTRAEDGTHKLNVGDFRNPCVQQCQDLQWIFTEKIDGTNIRVFWNGHTVEYGGRTDKAQLHPDLIAYLDKTFKTNEVEELFEQMFGEKEVYLFGEGYGAGIQTGGGYRADKAFILFDVQVNGKYLSDIAMREVATAFGLEAVPIVFAGQISSAIMFVNAQKYTTVGLQKHPFEGVVGRLKNEMYDSWGNRLIIKIKKCDFE